MYVFIRNLYILIKNPILLKIKHFKRAINSPKREFCNMIFSLT